MISLSIYIYVESHGSPLQEVFSLIGYTFISAIELKPQNEQSSVILTDVWCGIDVRIVTVYSVSTDCREPYQSHPTVLSKTNTTDNLRLLNNGMSFRYNNYKTL